mgnify:CR=1 FL=1
MTNIITIKKPTDCHIHLRDDAYLKRTVADAAAQFNTIVVMPNLTPPIAAIEDALSYRQRILNAVPATDKLNPLLNLYLHKGTTATLVKDVANTPYILGFKLYPRGATTNSDAGIDDISQFYNIFAAMEKHNVPLMIHAEDNSPTTDIFDRECFFIDKHITKLHKAFPELKITLEHITTKDAVEFISACPANLAATITAHHLWINRNDVINTKIMPHNFCLPIAKRKEHQQALIAAATSGNPKFFLGTDSAPHTQANKESACGCAGIYTAKNAIELYTEIFDNKGALSQLEGFASIYGPRFYGFAVANDTIELTKRPQKIEDTLEFGGSIVVPFKSNEQINWSLAS